MAPVEMKAAQDDPGTTKEDREMIEMETTTFDGLTRTFGSRMTRRSALRGLVATAAAAVAGGALLQVEDASAKRRKKSRKGSSTQPTTDQPQNGGTTPLLPPGSRCQSSSQCVAGYICEVPVNGSNSDKYCSGGPGAGCGAKNEDGDDSAPFCAVGHQCVYASSNGSSSWTCQAVPDEI
jgi:hypothetical protein